ncbi:MAG TPA: aldehyde dehydrogenase family protein [Mycobacteriales bacterium]
MDLQALIDGTWTGTPDAEVRSPYSGEVVGRVPSCTPEDVAAAVSAATAALARDDFPRPDRIEVLDRAAAALRERTEELARVIAAEAAKPLKTARVEAARAVDTFAFAAAEARALTGELVPVDAVPSGAGRVAYTMRVPIGVVAAISPFNFPLNLVAHKLAPAIAAGCPVVLKPATQTPLSALLLASLLHDLGVPRGWLNVVPGSGGTVGEALVTHPDVAYVSFTGSPEVGWPMVGKAPRAKVRLELGSNSPLVVEPDGDWRAAAAKAAVAAFSHAGQSCISTQRIYVHASVCEDFLAALVPAVEALVVGDPLDERTDVSSLISPADTERVSAWLAEAVAGGARVRCGGDVVAGVLRPTVVTDVKPDMKVVCQEVFGPVVTVTPYESFDEALRLANDSRYGLQAGVFTGSLEKALRAARVLRYGGVLVNEVPTWRADLQPYGGVKDSGNTREGPRYAIEEMTERRLVVLAP